MHDALIRVTQFLLAVDMLEEDLGFSQGTFRKAHNINDRASLTILRSLHYMPKPATNEEYWRCGSHADMSLLSLLFQKEGQGGLQICPGRDAITDWGMGDKWTEVPAKQVPSSAILATC